MQIEALYTYPIKALRAHSLTTAQLTKHGFAYDRRFMLLERKPDGSHRNMHIAEDPLGALFFPTLHEPSDHNAGDGKISVAFKAPGQEEKSLEIPLQPTTQGLDIVEVEMHKSRTKAYVMPAEYNDWFSACFGYPVLLAYLGEHYRPVLMSSTSTSTATSTSTTNNGSANWLSSITSTATSLLNAITPPPPSDEAKVTFADCAPYLLVSSASLPDLDKRFPDGKTKADMMKFRPNIVVSGADKAWDEDYWAEVTVGLGAETKIECVHNCGRCKSVNIDYETGKPGLGDAGKLLAKMQSDRRVDKGVKYSPVFGRYSFLHQGSEGQTISVGDEVVVSKRNSEHTRFDWKGLATS